MITLSYPVKFPPGFHLITLLSQAKSMITLSYPVKFPPGFHLITLLPQAKSMRINSSHSLQPNDFKPIHSY
jgi:hypothetical protein